jgi:hypothetical protein
VKVHPVRAGANQFLPPPEWLEVETAAGAKFDACTEACADKLVRGVEV